MIFFKGKVAYENDPATIKNSGTQASKIVTNFIILISQNDTYHIFIIHWANVTREAIAMNLDIMEKIRVMF